MKTNKIKASLIVMFAGLLITSCKDGSKESKNDATDTTSATKALPDSTSTPDNGSGSAAFDITSIPVSDKDLGEFPYFGVPENMKYQEEHNKKFHRSYLGINGKLVPVEGRTFAAYVFASSSQTPEFEQLVFENNYDNLIKGVGGVLVSNKKVESSEIERVGKDELFKYHSVADIYNTPVKTYVIRRADGEIWVQLSSTNVSGNIIVVQKGEMKQTASLIPAAEIKKQLDADGKAVLYIQFDTDKATLKPEGQKSVSEIAKLLNTDKELKLDIHGYTDNVGTEARNMKLSADRAGAVLDAVVSTGVEKSRLSSKGFGATNPLADNTTEDGRAKNRRVELVKK